MVSTQQLVAYCVVVSLFIDALASATDAITKRINFSSAEVAAMEIGSLSSRAKVFTASIPVWIVRAIIGFPMLHVTNLLMSKDRADIAEFSEIASAYDWQRSLLKDLPRDSWLPFFLDAPLYMVLQLILIGGFFITTYRASAEGFSALRKVRWVGDQLADGIAPGGISHHNVRSALLHLKFRGWDAAQLSAAAFFLFAFNSRVAIKSSIIQDMTPAQYGVRKVIVEAGIAAALWALHPVVLGLYLASEIGGARELLQFRLSVEKRVAQLPPSIQAAVASKLIQSQQ